MFLSIFEIFKIGVGPSSSHTMGPMVAAGMFMEEVRAKGLTPARLSCRLHGSLAFTGKGHRSDWASILGLAGFRPDDFDAAKAKEAQRTITETHLIRPPGHPAYRFDPESDLIFDYETALPYHANGIGFFALDADGKRLLARDYYSVGGGFVKTEAEMEGDEPVVGHVVTVPNPFKSAMEMVAMAERSGKSIAEVKRENELSQRCHDDLDAGINNIWRVMSNCIDAGLSEEGELPGGLHLKRRAKCIHDKLEAERGKNLQAPHIINDWIATYAMAVNEENAAGHQVVTAPTNGAAGVIPATLRYYLDHVPEADPAKIPEFLLTAAAIGGLIKTNASISGAEVGCQGEVGSASAMAAAGLCAILGGTPSQVENAAEIALEHHLGMTCDQIKGLVQAPCIERNGLGAIKAVSAASLSLRGNGKHLVSLDACIKTMLETGLDMNEKYKETSKGGLAVNLPAC
jgi:L-serine dehydratase